MATLIERFREKANAHSSHAKNLSGLQKGKVDLLVLKDGELCIVFRRENPKRNVVFRVFLDSEAVHILSMIDRLAERKSANKKFASSNWRWSEKKKLSSKLETSMLIWKMRSLISDAKKVILKTN